MKTHDCVHTDVQQFHNVDVTVSKCECGKIDVSWKRTPDTVMVLNDEEFAKTV